jgi:hypothetical protein
MSAILVCEVPVPTVYVEKWVAHDGVLNEEMSGPEIGGYKMRDGC